MSEPNIQINMEEKEMLTEPNIDDILNSFFNLSDDDDNNSYYVEEEDSSTSSENYENYTVKELNKIGDYYKIKNSKKVKKIDIIFEIISFENTFQNTQIVLSRKKMWYYINELKKDAFMKQYIIWG